MKKYVEGLRGLGVDLRVGYLFWFLDLLRILVLDNYVIILVMLDRLKKYFIILNIYEGEIVYSFRVGCGIILMVNNIIFLEEIMEYVGW